MDGLNELKALEDIRRLKALYFLYLDGKDWARWRSLFADDAVLMYDRKDEEGRTVTHRYEGADTLVEHTRSLLHSAPSVHHGHTPIIDLESESAARGIWAMADIIDYGAETMRGNGHYRELYVKIDGEWKFRQVHLTRLKVDFTPS